MVTEEDSLKVILSWLEQDYNTDQDEDGGLRLDELEDEEGGLDMMKVIMDDDPHDLDWLPTSKCKHVQARVPGVPDHERSTSCKLTDAE
jgi:hypothetical protein